MLASVREFIYLFENKVFNIPFNTRLLFKYFINSNFILHIKFHYYHRQCLLFTIDEKDAICTFSVTSCINSACHLCRQINVVRFLLKETSLFISSFMIRSLSATSRNIPEIFNILHLGPSLLYLLHQLACTKINHMYHLGFHEHGLELCCDSAAFHSINRTLNDSPDGTYTNINHETYTS